MNSTRLPILCVGVLAVFAGTLSQSACSDDETTTTTTATTTGDMPTTTTTSSTSTGMGGNTGGGGNVGGNMGGNGGGGLMTTGEDTCDGTLVTMPIGFSGTFFGDTTGLNDDYESACELVDGPDVVYQLDVAAPGTLAIQATPGGGYDVSVYMRKVCDDRDTTIFCRNNGGPTIARNWITNIDLPGSYYLFVDTDGAAGGNYLLDLVYTAPDCGDGATNPGEQCDDGNQNAGDGCAPNCTFEMGSNDSCADPLETNVPVGDLVIAGNTLGNTDAHTFEDVQCGHVEATPGGHDRVHALTAQASGTMRIRVGWDETTPPPTDPSICADPLAPPGCYGRVVHVRWPACALEADQIACAGQGSPPAYVQDFTFPVEAGETYYVFVDSFWDGGGTATFAAGPYQLHVNLTAD